MNSIILRTGARVLLPALLVLSVVILFQGHNEPGGGFVGGLVAASAFALYSLAFGTEPTRKIIGVELNMVYGAGLLMAVLSGAFGLIWDDHFLEGVWRVIDVPSLGELKVSNIVFFDIGVYLTVIGVVLTMIFSLEDSPTPRPGGSQKDLEPVSGVEHDESEPGGEQ